MSKNDIQLIAVLVITILFVGSMMYAMWTTTDPSICKRKMCTAMAWGIRAFIIAMPIGVSVFVFRLFNQKEDPNMKAEKPKEESFDYSKMGASSEIPFRHGVE